MDNFERRTISAELMPHIKQKFIEEKRRQLLRENNNELRQLENHLKKAYISKQLDEQKADHQKRKLEELRSKQEESQQLELTRHLMLEECKAKEQIERQKKANLLGMLKSQIAETQKQKLHQYEKMIRDRDEMQKLSQKLEQEHIAELTAQKQRIECFKLEMEELEREQTLLKLKKGVMEADENEALRRILKKRDEETLQAYTKRKLELEKKQAISAKIGQELYQIEQEKRTRDSVLLELLMAEREAKEDYRFRHTLEKQEAARIQMCVEMKRYRDQLLKDKKEQQVKEEAQLREEHTRMLAERDKLEQLSDQRRRQKQLEHKRDTQIMLEERRRQRNTEAAEKLQAYEIHLQEECKKQQQIEDERISILRSHPTNILRFLPAGVLRESDREFLSLPPSSK